MRYLIAKIFNLDLVSFRFAFQNEFRFVRTDADGNKYVRAYGSTIRISNARDLMWINRRK